MKKKCREVNIRSASIRDIDCLVNWWADGKVMAHAGFPNGLKTDKKQLKDRLLKSRETTSPDSEILIISCDNLSIGEMNYRKINHNTFSIGIKICDFEYHNSGVGTKAMKLLLDYLFNDRAAVNVVLDTNLSNKGAQRFYERLGFIQTDIKKDFWTNQLGNPQTVVFYKLDKEKYSTLKE